MHNQVEVGLGLLKPKKSAINMFQCMHDFYTVVVCPTLLLQWMAFAPEAVYLVVAYMCPSTFVCVPLLAKMGKTTVHRLDNSMCCACVSTIDAYLHLLRTRTWTLKSGRRGRKVSQNVIFQTHRILPIYLSIYYNDTFYYNDTCIAQF